MDLDASSLVSSSSALDAISGVPEVSGSRWYFPVFEGLFAGKHVAQMGQGIWLYGWMLSRAWVARKEGQFAYSHVEAARELGRSERTVKRWFTTLQKHGYIHTSARHQYHLEVEVSNWRPIEEWLESRQRSGVSLLALPTKAEVPKSVRRSDIRSDTSDTPSISIRLLGYEYPKGAPVALISLAGVFQSILAWLKGSKNRQAVLRQFYRLCFGGQEEDLPTYSLVGKLARELGGAGRAAQFMWVIAARPITGQPWRFMLGMIKRAKKQGRDAIRTVEDMSEREWQEAMEYTEAGLAGLEEG